jgi:type IV pilus assembly protein PilY1
MKLTRLFFCGSLAFLGLTSTGVAAPPLVDLNRSPVFVRQPVDPNIVLTFDDSGSMNLGITPNEIDGNYLPNGNGTDRCFWRDYPHVYAAAANSQYYDPAITYAPPVYEDGDSYPNAVYTAAYLDGFNAHRTKNVVAVSPTRNLATNYAVSLYGPGAPYGPTACKATDPNPTGFRQPGGNNNTVELSTAALSSATCNVVITYKNCNGDDQTQSTDGGVLGAPDQGGFYYVYNNTNPIDPATGKPAKPTRNQLYGTAVPYNRGSYSARVSVNSQTANEKQNFANWYSYYRTRTLMGRSASTRAFSQLPRNVRVAWQGMNSDRLGENNDGTAKTLLPIKRIDDVTQRKPFYDYLSRVSTSGGTPTRGSSDRVGRFFSQAGAKTDFTETNPYYDISLGKLLAPGNLTGPYQDPNSVLSCRQNYHMIFTDGGWKDNVNEVVISAPGDPKETRLQSNYVDQNTDQTVSPLPDTRAFPDGVHTRVYDSGPPQSRVRNGTYEAADNIGGFADRAFYWWRTDLQPTLNNNVSTFLDDRTTGVTGGVVSPLPLAPFTEKEIYWNPKNDPATWQHLVHYVVAFGLTSSLNFPADLNNLRTSAIVPIVPTPTTGPTTKAVVWTDWANVEQGDPAVKVDDTWHATLNSRGELLAASNPQELVEQMNTVFQSIAARTASVSAVSVSAGLLSTSTLAYRTFFNTTAWSGTVQASTFTNNSSTIVWDAGCKLTGGVCTTIVGSPSFVAPDPATGRVIYTINGTTGTNFDWGSLTASQQADLNVNWDLTPKSPDGFGAQRLAFIRGDRSLESSKFRVRDSVMGAVVNSNAVFVGKAVDEYWFKDSNNNGPIGVIFPSGTAPVPGPETKAPFRAHYDALASRPGTVYVGANDGMLHAFNAVTGDERWAYVPSIGFAGLSRLTSKSQLFTQSSVDNTPIVREVFTSPPSGGSAQWRTMLVGSMRLGGQGVFALDITNPLPTGAASKVLWEFSDRSPVGSGTSDGKDMGYSYGRPFITRLRTGKWVVLVPSGYNSNEADGYVGTGSSVLFVLDASTGSVIRKIVLPATSSGLASVVGGDYVFKSTAVNPSRVEGPQEPIIGRGQASPADVLKRSGDEVTDVAFAGDNDGDLWRFNLEDPNPANWSFQKFFDSADGQKITMDPYLIASGGKARVVFGTGRFVNTIDRADVTKSSIYGLIDSGPEYPYGLVGISQSNLQQQTLTITGNLRKTSSTSVDKSQLGWYFNLKPLSGERVIASATYLESTRKLIIPAFAPQRNPATAADACLDDPVSFLYFINPANGGPASFDDTAAFDTNGDGIVNTADDKTITGVEVSGFIAGATPLTQAGGGQGAVLLPSEPGQPINRLAIPDFTWRRTSQRDLPAWDPNDRN